jgi:hypothetical protein
VLHFYTALQIFIQNTSIEVRSHRRGADPELLEAGNVDAGRPDFVLLGLRNVDGTLFADIVGLVKEGDPEKGEVS